MGMSVVSARSPVLLHEAGLSQPHGNRLKAADPPDR
jgi:hypothetical protein